MDCGALDTRRWNLAIGVLALSVVGCGPSIFLIGDTDNDTDSQGDGVGDDGTGTDAGDGIDPTGGIIGCVNTDQCPAGLVCINEECVDDGVVDDAYDDDYYDSDVSDYYDDDAPYCYEYGPRGQCCDYDPCPEYCEDAEECQDHQQCLEGEYEQSTCVDVPMLEECLGGTVIMPWPIPIDEQSGQIEKLAFVDADPTSPGSELVIGYEFGAPALKPLDDPPQVLPIPDAMDNIGSGGAVGGDFTGDLLPDVLVVDGLGSVHVLAGDGLGDFTLASTLAADFLVADGNAQLEALDFDGDGALDVAGVLSAEHPMVLLNDGAGAFGAFVEPSLPLLGGLASLTAGQLNGLGATDLALSTTFTDAVYLGIEMPPARLVSSAEGTLPPPSMLGLRQLATGDFDLDGTDALLGGSPVLGHGTLIHSMRPQGQASYFVPDMGVVAGVGDVDGGGVVDLALVGSELIWLRGMANADAAEVFECYQLHPSGFDAVTVMAVGDHDGNGLADVAVSDGAEIVVHLAF